MTCAICERITQIKTGTNQYFVKELTSGYVGRCHMSDKFRNSQKPESEEK